MSEYVMVNLEVFGAFFTVVGNDAISVERMGELMLEIISFWVWLADSAWWGVDG
jgi:hypothetical protein